MLTVKQENSPLQSQKRYFTTAEYHRMSEAGILGEDDRVELVEGEILEMAAMGSRHAACVDRLNRHLNKLVGDTGLVRVQSPGRTLRY